MKKILIIGCGLLGSSLIRRIHKKFINSHLNIYANQIQKISDNFERKINNDRFAVDISDSLKIMKNLSLWSNLIKNK